MLFFVQPIALPRNLRLVFLRRWLARLPATLTWTPRGTGNSRTWPSARSALGDFSELHCVVDVRKMRATLIAPGLIRWPCRVSLAQSTASSLDAVAAYRIRKLPGPLGRRFHNSYRHSDYQGYSVD